MFIRRWVCMLFVFSQILFCAYGQDLDQKNTNLSLMHLSDKAKMVHVKMYSAGIRPNGKLMMVLRYKITNEFNKKGQISNEYHFETAKGNWFSVRYYYNAQGQLASKNMFFANRAQDDNLSENGGSRMYYLSMRNQKIFLPNRDYSYTYRDVADSIQCECRDESRIVFRTVSNNGLPNRSIRYEYGERDSLLQKTISIFNTNGQLSEVTVENQNVVVSKTNYLYRNSGSLQEVHTDLMIAIKSQIPPHIICGYDESGDLLYKEEYDKDHLLLRRYDYEYKYDIHGNWTTKTELIKGKLVAEYQRSITYFR